MVRALALLLALTFLMPALGTSGAAEGAGNQWSCYGGNAAHDHMSAFSTQDNRGGLAWQISFPNNLGGQPVISADGMIYVGDREGNFTSIYPNGSLAKTVRLPGSCCNTPALGKNGSIIVVTILGGNDPYREWWNDDVILVRLNAELDIVWTLNMTGHPSSPVLGEDDTIYLSTSGLVPDIELGYYAISSDGEVKWFIPNYYETGGKIPAVGPDGSVYVGDMDLPIRALSPDGDMIWEFWEVHPWEVQIGERASYEQAPACIGPDGSVYLGTSRHNMYAFDAEGNVKWKFEAPTDILTSASLAADGTILFSTCYDQADTSASSLFPRLYALDQDGHLKWSFKFMKHMLSPAVTTPDGMIYFTDNEGTLYALDQDGDLLWKVEGAANYHFFEDPVSPVIGSDGTIYTIHADRLKAFKIGTPPAPDIVHLYRDGDKARVTWDPPSTDGGSAIVKYQIYRCGDNWNYSEYEPMHLVGTVDADEGRSFEEGGLLEDWHYGYSVVAINEFGAGGLKSTWEIEEGQQFPLFLLVVILAVAALTVLYLVRRYRR